MKQEKKLQESYNDEGRKNMIALKRMTPEDTIIMKLRRIQLC